MARGNGREAPARQRRRLDERPGPVRRRRPDRHSAAEVLARHRRPRRPAHRGGASIASPAAPTAGAGARPRHHRRRRLRDGGRARSEEARTRVRDPRADRAVLDRRQLPRAQADLHLPERHDARRASCSSATRFIRRSAARRPAPRDDAGIDAALARAESVARSGELLQVEPRRRRTAARGPPRDRRDRPHRETSASSTCPAKTSTRSTTACTTRRTSPAKNVLVVGGGDSALETAIALAEVRRRTSRSPTAARSSPAQAREHRAARELAARVRPAFGSMHSSVDGEAHHRATTSSSRCERRRRRCRTTSSSRCSAARRRSTSSAQSGVRIRGEWTAQRAWSAFVAFLAVLRLCSTTGRRAARVTDRRQQAAWLNSPTSAAWSTGVGGPARRSLGARSRSPRRARLLLLARLLRWSSSSSASRRIRRRKTPYVTWQTLTLMAIQVVPLFLLPYIVLPWLGHNGCVRQRLARLASPTNSSRASTTATAASTGARSASSSRGRCSSGTCSPTSRCGRGSIIGFVQTFVIIPLII